MSDLEARSTVDPLGAPTIPDSTARSLPAEVLRGSFDLEDLLSTFPTVSYKLS